MVLLMVILLQIVAAVVIVFVLSAKLKRELVQAAIQALDQVVPQGDIREVTALAAGPLASVDELELMTSLKHKFPLATVKLVISPEIRGGLVIKAGDLLMDYSFLSRIKRIFGEKDE